MQEMTLESIRDVFRMHHGAAAWLARKLCVTDVTVHMVLQGKTKSARIVKAANKHAIELMTEDEK